MHYIRQLLLYFLLMFFANYILIIGVGKLNPAIKLVGFLLLFFVFIRYNIGPNREVMLSKRLRFLRNGYHLLNMSIACFLSEIALYLILDHRFNFLLMTLNAIGAGVVIFVLLLNGFVRTFSSSTQLGLGRRVFLVLFWWIPILNLIFLYRVCRITADEYKFECAKFQRNAARKKDTICKTKYPILFVHGIFFRDWPIHNYWGRIPGELIENGASVYYGKQQSALSVEQSARELKKRILEIQEETGCEKVNIIAHSKGGLDARYAVSCLGMAPNVASLTMINTPHFGCKYTDEIMKKTPNVLAGVGRAYEGLYKVLGDHEPDFLSGFKELTVQRCKELNEIMPDCEGVFYRSVVSKMQSKSSAGFPMNVGYRLIQPEDGDNDGLVSVKSAIWTGFLGILAGAGKRGISHGDMIDLTGVNIKGFDVCEFYVSLVKELKDRGL